MSPNKKKFDELLPRYLIAYKKCNDKDIEASYENGYVHVGSFFGGKGSKHRIAEFEQMTKTLEKRVVDPFDKLDVLSTLSNSDKFKLANDVDFSLAIIEAETGRAPLSRWSFNTIGDRVRLITELEKAGFRIIKATD